MNANQKFSARQGDVYVVRRQREYTSADMAPIRVAD